MCRTLVILVKSTETTSGFIPNVLGSKAQLSVLSTFPAAPSSSSSPSLSSSSLPSSSSPPTSLSLGCGERDRDTLRVNSRLASSKTSCTIAVTLPLLIGQLSLRVCNASCSSSGLTALLARCGCSLTRFLASFRMVALSFCRCGGKRLVTFHIDFA